MKKYLYSVALLLFVSFTNAQEKTMSFSMQEAIDYALKNNFNAKQAENNIAAAKKKKWETTTIGLPQVNAKVDYQNWLKQQVSLFPASFGDQYSQLRGLSEFYDLSSLAIPGKNHS